jgi:hypothetical protein
MRIKRIVLFFLTIAIPYAAYAQQARKPESTSQTMEGTVIGLDGTKYWSGFKIESGGKEYTIVTEYNAKQGTNPTIVGGKCCDIGTQVRVTYIGSITRYLLDVTRIVILNAATGGLVSVSSQPAAPKFADELASFPAPSEGFPSGMAFVGNSLWVVQENKLWKLSANGVVQSEWGIQGIISDIASDGKFIYVLPHGWTVGEPIYVIDPAKPWEVNRTIVTGANRGKNTHSAGGIACRNGKLYILDNAATGNQGTFMGIHIVNPTNGTIERTIDTGEKVIGGLGFDGKQFVTIGYTKPELVFLNADTLRAERRVPMGYQPQNVEPYDGRLYLMERPDFVSDPTKKPATLWPNGARIRVMRSLVEEGKVQNTPTAPSSAASVVPRTTLVSHGFDFDNGSVPMVSIKGSAGSCQVQAFVMGESTQDRYGYTGSKMDRATFVGQCVGGYLEGVSIVIAEGSTKVNREAFVSYFSKGRIAYPALRTFLDVDILNLGVQEKNNSYGCVYFGKWDRSDTSYACPKFKVIFGNDIFSESNARALRNGSFDLSKYSNNFSRFVSGLP